MSGGKIAGVILASLLGLAVIFGGIYAIRVAIAPVTGAGDAYIEQQSAENWTAAQARFESYFQEIEATQGNIKIARDALAADPENPTLRTNLSGVLAHCNNTVADYNAEARSYLSEEFRAADLPAQIDPAFYCN